MNKDILLISQGSTFMVDAISTNLKEAGFKVTKCGPVIKELKEHTNDANIYLFYLGDFLDDVTEALVYLKDVCIESEKSLNVIGDDDELESLYKSINQSVIANVFTRPLDIKKVVEKLEDVVESKDEYNSRKNILLVDDILTT